MYVILVYDINLDDLPDSLKKVKKTREDILNYLYNLNKIQLR